MNPSVYSDNLESLKKLRTLLNARVSDHLLEILAEETYRKMSVADFRSACKTFSEKFQPSPLKTFPLLPDFLAKGKTSKLISPTHAYRLGYAQRHNLEIAEILQIPIWRLEAAETLGIHPATLPEHADALSEEQRNILGLEKRTERALFSTNTLSGMVWATQDPKLNTEEIWEDSLLDEEW